MAAHARAPRRFPHVDALRAFAAIAVLGTHAAIFAGADYPGSDVGLYAQRLEVGRGDLLRHLGLPALPPVRRRARPRAAPGRASARTPGGRLLRIVPAYWLALTVSALLLGTAGCSR